MINVKKPLTVLRDDFISSVVNLCNNSGLPYFVVESVLRDILNEVRVAGQNQLDSDRRKHEEELRKLSAQEVDGDENVSF